MRAFKMMFPLFLAAGVLLSACATEEPAGAGESVELQNFQDSISLPYDGSGDVSFSVNSNRTWSITKSPDFSWLKLSSLNGGSGRTSVVTVSADMNDDLERTAWFTFHCGSVEKVIEVTQAAFPIVPEIKVGLEEGALSFAFNTVDPVSFNVWGNVRWTVEKNGLEWLEVSPCEGERKTDVIVTVTPVANTGPERNGTLVFKAEGAPDVVIPVTQDEYVDEPFLKIAGIPEDGRIAFERKPSSPLTLSLSTNRGWKIVKSGGMEWITVSPESGSAAENALSISLSAGENTSDTDREGKLTIISDDSSVEDIVLTLSQKGYERQWIWTLDHTVLSASKWASEARSFCDAETAVMEWLVENNDSFYASPADRKPVVSSDGLGHYAYKQVWTNDNLQFTVPVEDLPANTTVSIQFAMSANQYIPAFWIVEYLEPGSDNWLPTSLTSLTSKRGSTMDATFVLPAKDKVVNVKESAVIGPVAGTGTLKFRIRCAAGEYQVDASSQTKAHSKGTLRFRQWSDGTCNEMRIKIEK